MLVLAALAASISLAVPGRTNATPSLAADGVFVVAAWSAMTPAGTTDLYAAVSRDSAGTFGPPVRVNAMDGDAHVNGEQPPRVALTRQSGPLPAITIVWTTKGRSGTKLATARSIDGGRSFIGESTVPNSDAAGNRGWHNVLAGSNGSVYAIWLDHREMAGHAMAGAPSHEHGGSQQMDGATMAQQSKLFIGTLDGAVPPHAVTGGVCYCCKTAIARGPGGMIAAAWRHVYPGNFRDIAFTASHDGGRTFATPVRVSEDKWMLEGCPDDGPAIAIDAGKVTHVAWPTLVTDEKTAEPTIAIFYASSSDGRTFTPRVRVPTEGVAHHPQIVIGPGETPFLAWDESANGARRVVVSSTPAFKRAVVSDGAGVYPSIVVAREGVVAAWTSAQPSGSIIRVQRLN